jgi:hypothetical protein
MMTAIPSVNTALHFMFPFPDIGAVVDEALDQERRTVLFLYVTPSPQSVNCGYRGGQFTSSVLVVPLSSPLIVTFKE